MENEDFGKPRFPDGPRFANRVEEHPTIMDVLAGEVANAVLPLMPDQSIETFVAVRDAVQAKLESDQSRDYMNRIVNPAYGIAQANSITETAKD